MKQKDVFLESEGDAWLRRNLAQMDSPKFDESDPLLREVLNLPSAPPETRILEIGCADGTRLGWLKEHRHWRCYGVEPSAQAVELAKERGIDAYQGTAERLPFDDQCFDIVMFGFCLYLCDREDLFRIASEADRVLKNSGWLLILDFFSPTPLKREYHHRAGLYSYKMDYRSLFSWNPAYTIFTHNVRHHSGHAYTDESSEWIATSVLRKNMNIG